MVFVGVEEEQVSDRSMSMDVSPKGSNGVVIRQVPGLTCDVNEGWVLTTTPRPWKRLMAGDMERYWVQNKGDG